MISCSAARERGVGAAAALHHQLRHVALHAHLAGHERLHAGLLIAGDEHRAGGVDVGRHREVGAVGRALAEQHLAVLRAHEELDVSSPSATSRFITRFVGGTSGWCSWMSFSAASNHGVGEELVLVGHGASWIGRIDSAAGGS